MPFSCQDTDLTEVKIIIPQYFEDSRGGFAELYNESDFAEAGIEMKIKQINYSRSGKNVLRGLHYQIEPKSQGKLIRVVKGEIFDVAVDIRRKSADYGHWMGETLSGDNRKMLYIPRGFGHGFQVISETVEVVYYCDEEYAPEQERGIMWNDVDLAIAWPSKNVILSAKDKQWPGLAEAEINF